MTTNREARRALEAQGTIRRAGHHVARLLDSAMSAGQQDKIAAYCDALNILDAAYNWAGNAWLSASR